ncbi:DHA2 family efflux MFS transporter permease subunit [Hoyosella altamirensis]|uniref:EmrB/QacA subfamily drug resistance transporter n=1 Tax=Hoyosella altamirensis TaxID=616997 RepID=A0A839RMP1_9ACTN|nr:DHA2 family efflux MFS transporter permease subunit [Hoyosella altamirensis]MBB3037201.1 EmrB/QacA subfamily drug resistance transporter [Hoyosella altamirensis]
MPTPATSPHSPVTATVNPWAGLWALCLGFFMILVDTTIVTVATPTIMRELDTDIATAVWVTSGYLLAFAVPLLITGRLGDRFGPKRVYMAGLITFACASVACGLSGSIAMLIAARVVQGLGASLMSPQTMAIITRTFPPERRGAAMGMWGAVAGAATLAGPLLGGVIVGTLGWEWIFFVNIPLGVLAFVLAWRLVPDLPRTARRIDALSVALSACAVFLIVFGIQEGSKYSWGIIIGFVSIPLIIAAGVVTFALFLLRQAIGTHDPLLPLSIFRDRNFSLAAFGISTMGFASVSMFLPVMLYAQEARGFSAARAALLLVPVAVLAGVLAPLVGRAVDRIDARMIAVPSFLLLAASTAWLGLIMRPDTEFWLLVIPLTLIGIANAGIWSPLSTTATRALAHTVAGAGAGVYNTTRQTGAVLGSAGIAALMAMRSTALGVPVAPDGNTVVPTGSADAFSIAMGQSLFLPAAVLLAGAVAAFFFVPRHYRTPAPTAS